MLIADTITGSAVATGGIGSFNGGSAVGGGTGFADRKAEPIP